MNKKYEHGNKGRKVSLETRKKMSESKKGKSILDRLEDYKKGKKRYWVDQGEYVWL